MTTLKYIFTVSFFLLFVANIEAQNIFSKKMEIAIDTATFLTYRAEIDSFYKQNKYKKQFSKQLVASTLVELDNEELASISQKRDVNSRVSLELRIVEELFSLYRVTNNGKIPLAERQFSEDENAGFHFEPKTPDYNDLLATYLTEKDIRIWTTSSIEIAQVKSLEKTIKMYQDAQVQGGWDSIFINDYETYCLGDRKEAVEDLRKRLYATGDLKSSVKLSSYIFDKDVEQALKIFQERHRLDTTGVLDSKTVEVLNVSVDERLAVLYVNLERWKWLPDELSDYYVISNIPTFSTQLFEDDEEIAFHKTVVGKLSRQTPFFTDTMTYLDLNPTWTVPPTILENDIVPNASTSYLNKKNITVINATTGEVVPKDSIVWSSYKKYKFIQGAGSSNALGEVKFIFPNSHYIFIHDTPTKYHFSLDKRAYSSGCMRIENPRDFTYTLLQDNDYYTTTYLDSIWDSGRTKRIVLDKKPLVFVTYFTVWIDDDGLASFYNDVYSFDDAMWEKLKAIN